MKLNTIEKLANKASCRKKVIFVIVLTILMLISTPMKLLAYSKSNTDKSIDMIFGIVSDKTGPLPGVTISVKGTTISTVSDYDGKYSLKNVPENAHLVFSFIGYRDYEVEVKGISKIDVVLQEDNINLKEVVVIGYGTVKKSDLTGAVSTISKTKYAEQNITRLDQILQGRAAGVQVAATVGAPGADVKVRIRGANSVLGSNEPLYVIDGYVGADFNVINPNDIESLQVLKDASSTAIYGSRGANGVIIIKTKNGKNGKMIINVQTDVSVSSVVKKLDVLSAADYAITVNERRAETNGSAPLYSPSQIDAFRANRGTDWQDEVFRSAISKNTQLNVSGGSEKINYMISLNALDQDGIVENSGYKRFNLRSNLSSQISEKLSIRLNIAGTNSSRLNSVIRTGSTSNALVQMLSWAPITPAYDDSGNYTISDPSSSVKPNPLALIYDQEIKEQAATFNAIGGFNYKILDGLSFDSQYAINYFTRKNKSFGGVYATNNSTYASIYNGQETTFQTTNSLNYNKTINNHSINAVVVLETQKFDGYYDGGSATGLRYPELKYDNLGQASANTASSSFSGTSLLSYLGRVNYSFKDKYLLSLSVRRDGSSKFVGDNKYSTFPSAALAWNLANENFISKMDVFSTLKLRGSWGLTGSQAIAPYATFTSFNGIVGAFNGTGGVTTGIQLGNLGNKDLKWETTEQKDLGIEIGFFKGRLTAEFDYFVKNTSDLLLNNTIPSYLGGGIITSNIGDIQNKGYELALGASIVENKNFSWKSDFTCGYVKNKVISLIDPEKPIFSNPNTTALSGGQPEFVYKVGESLSSFWTLNYLGTWKPADTADAAKYGQKPGDARYEDLNGDFKIDGKDYKITGKGMPSTTLGWNNTFNYKKLTLNMFFVGIFGYQKLNYTRAIALSGTGDTRQVILDEIKDRYIPGVNETSQYPAFSATGNIQRQSTLFLEQGDFVRLKNLSISYKLPKIEKVEELKLSLMATNLLTFTKYKGFDPESGSSNSDLNQGVDYGSYPNSKTFTVGISMSF